MKKIFLSLSLVFLLPFVVNASYADTEFLTVLDPPPSVSGSSDVSTQIANVSINFEALDQPL